MKTAVLVAVLAAFLIQKTRAVCHPVVVSQKGFRLDTPTDIFVNFHQCDRVVTVRASLGSLPEGREIHDVQEVKNFEHRNKPVKISIQAKSEKLELRFNMKVYETVLKLSFCEHQNCAVNRQIPAIKVVLNNTHGYMFLTTDRPAYRPGENVKIAVGITEQNLRMGNRATVQLHIKTPNDKGRITIKTLNLNKTKGILIQEYQLSSEPMLGVWWIEAHVDGTKMAEKSFVIDRYELPTFQVKILPERYFILPMDKFIRGKLTAEYSYGKKVRGSYYMSFRLKRADGVEEEFHKIPEDYNSPAKIPLGLRTYEVSVEDLKKILKEGESLERFATDGGAKVVIYASVTGDVRSVFESDYVGSIIFSKSPYYFDHRKSAAFYVQDTIYRLRFTVRDTVFHLPVPKIRVKVTVAGGPTKSLKTDKNGFLSHLIDTFDESDTQNIRLAIDGFEDTFVVYKHQVDHQLVMDLKTSVIEVGENQDITLHIGTLEVTDIRIFIVSRGEIVFTATKIPTQRSQLSFSFEVTPLMVPHARAVAYFIHQNKVISQSVYFDVVNKCENDLVLSTDKDEIKPGDNVEVTIDGAPDSTVLLKAVDRAAYFVHNGTRLNPDVLWKKMEDYDTACSVEGGLDSASVFKEAGLSFNGFDIRSRFRSMFCVPELRKKRNAPEVLVIENGVSLEKCSRDGQKVLPGVTCEYRIKQIRKNLEKQGKLQDNIVQCVASFNATCTTQNSDDSSLARSANEANQRAEEVAVQIRKDFKENWFFRKEEINESGEKKIKMISQHSISTYDIDAFGMGKTSPVCIAKSASIKVFQKVFIQLYLPYSVRIGEQAMIKFAVFNYGKETLKNIEIYAKHTKELCSKVGTDFKFLQTMTIEGNAVGQSLAFSVLPIKMPLHGLKAKIEIEIPDYDHVIKELLIEEPGQHNESDHTLLLTTDEDNPESLIPTKDDIVFDIPKRGVMPNTKKCWLYAYSHPMGPSIQHDDFDGTLANVGNLVRAPGGCGEQNMIYSAPTIFVHEYRFAVWGEEVTDAQTKQAEESIRKSYEVELNHLSKPAGRQAFAVWSSHSPSTWLNAFVTKVFSAGRKIYPEMDTKPLCNAINWMINQQVADGHFEPGRRVHHQEMIGQVTEDISLAAYVAISLQESTETCPIIYSRIYEASRKAMNFVRGRKVEAQANTYTLALGAYALSLLDPSSAEAREWNGLLREQKRNEGEYVYWHGNKGIASHIEVTGYALLAEVSLNGINEGNDLLTRNTAYWLISKRNANGGFRSTQDTVVALQALAKYMTILETSVTNKPPQTKMTVMVQANSSESEWHEDKNPLIFELGVEHTGKSRKYEVPTETIAEGAKVFVSGVGTGALMYRCTWRQYSEEGKCHFTVEVSIEDDEDDVKLLKVFVSKPNEPKAQMSIIDVGLLTGFEPVKESIKQLSPEVVDGSADRYEITQNTVKFYLSEIDSEGVHLNFKIREISKSYNRQAASVSAYDYYEPDIRCTKFYNMEGEHRIRTSCKKPEGEQKEICKCCEGACPMCRTWAEQLNNTVCSTFRKEEEKCEKKGLCKQLVPKNCYNIHSDSCKAAYVYVVTVKKVGDDESGEYKYFTAEVNEVFRNTASHSEPKGSVVKFLIRHDCYDNCRDDERYKKIASEKLKKKKKIVEPEDHIKQDRILLIFDSKKPYKEGGGYIYELGENGHIEATISSNLCFCDTAKCEKRRAKNGKENLCMLKSVLRSSHISGCDI